MIKTFIEEKIRRAFSKAANQYDVMSQLHKEIGRELLADLRTLDPKVVLDIGTGTGWLLNRLGNEFPDADIMGLDFSWSMLCQAREDYDQLRVIQGHAEHLPLQTQVADLVTTNLAYQWVQNLEVGLKDIHRVLKPGGVFKGTIFAHDTFKELFDSFESNYEQWGSIEFSRLPKAEDIKSIMMQVGFSDVEVRQEMMTMHYPDYMALLAWIKNIGANALPRRQFIGPKRLRQAGEYYTKHHSDWMGLIVTFEVLWLEGWR